MSFVTRYNVQLVTPLHDADMPLFLHCSGGLESVTPSFFQSNVLPILEIHGVTDIHVPIVGTIKEQP